MSVRLVVEAEVDEECTATVWTPIASRPGDATVCVSRHPSGTPSTLDQIKYTFADTILFVIRLLRARPRLTV